MCVAASSPSSSSSSGASADPLPTVAELDTEEAASREYLKELQQLEAELGPGAQLQLSGPAKARLSLHHPKPSQHHQPQPESRFSDSAEVEPEELEEPYQPWLHVQDEL